MEQKIRDKEAYRRVTEAFQRQRKGATVADIVAKTALPLNTVREMVPRVADEYSARLQVTESGEILYSFPRGFTSKYRGFKAGFNRFVEKCGRALKIAVKALFKVWIMVMLLGYFVLFMVIALGALMISVAGSSNSNRSSNRNSGGIGGMYFASNILNLIIRIWFYSELTKSLDRRYDYGRPNRAARPKGRPLYKAIFSFVFGDGDPNADWPSREKQAVIAYIQGNRGVISLPEFMALTGNSPAEAEDRITAYCAEFGGLPEATEDGTVVYRFDDLLLGADKKNRPSTENFAGGIAPIKRLFSFSSNPPKLNHWFGVINTVNLAFGSYFLYNALTTGAILTQAQFDVAPHLYRIAYLLFSGAGLETLPLMSVGLGIVPMIFSLLFWLIPGLRYLGMRETNETIKLENLRKSGYRRIWDTPLSVRPADIVPKTEECRPQKITAARDRIIKEIGSYAVPEVTIGQAGETVYAFKELEREKEALEKYRSEINAGASVLGKTVFDSE
jgi:hypothetical protein